MTNVTTKMKMGDMKHVIGADTIGVKDGVYTARRGFFYTLGYSADKMADAVVRMIPGASIVDSGMIYKDFRGGASVARGSHFFVKFTI